MILTANILAIFGCALGVLGIAGLIVLLFRQARRARPGYEDQEGFHHLPGN